MVKGERTRKAPPRVLTKEDIDLVKICSKLYAKTLASHEDLDQSSTSLEHSLLAMYSSTDCDEFTQQGLKNCIKFCTNLPGTSELATCDLAKLLKYGIYEIAVRYSAH